MSHPDFTVDIYQNEYLPEGARDVSAVITVSTTGTAGMAAAAAPAAEADSAEIIIIDCSGSMMNPGPRSRKPVRPLQRLST